MTCSDIAAGDVDGDGKPDLFLANGPGPNLLNFNAQAGAVIGDIG